MRHLGMKTLTTERLVLRRFEEMDAEPLHQHWVGDMDVVRFMRMPPQQSLEDTRAFVLSTLAQYEKPDTYRWVIVPTELGEPVGFIGLMTISEHDESADFAYTLGKAYWGHGYATEALRAVIIFGLLEVGYNRLEAYHALRNIASGRVMRNAGMTCEGKARQKYKSHMGYEDCGLYAILREDMLKRGSN